MKTLADYIKGYPCVPVLLLLYYKDENKVKYYLCKEPGYDNYYYMKEEEVLDRKHIKFDKTDRLSIDYLNHKDNMEILSELKEQQAYKYFVTFIKEQTGSDYDIKR